MQPLGPIHSASSVPLRPGPGSVPNVTESLTDWFQQLTFTRIVKSIVNFQEAEVPTQTVFYGVRVPFSPQQLMMKPIGQREWHWEAVYAYPTLQLKPDDQIIFNGITYRVMGKTDYKEYGYLIYEIKEDYTP